MYSVASYDPELRNGDQPDVATPAGNVVRDLLLLCAASPFTTEPQRPMDAAIPDFDWAGVLAAAQNHGLIPHLYEHLAIRPEPIPGRARERLIRAWEQSAHQTLWLTQLLSRISDLLNDRGIIVMPYKGPVLAQQLYGDVTRRQYSDLDILVSPAEVPRAAAALREIGLRPGLILNAAQQKAHFASGYEITFDSANAENVMELQWRILPRFYAIDFEVEKLFGRAQAVNVAGKEMLTLSNEDLFLVLCAHAAKHCWSQLSWMCDVWRLAQDSSLDWDRINAEAERLGIRRIVAITLSVAKIMLGGALPAGADDWKDFEARRIAERIAESLTEGVGPDVESLTYFRVIIQTREHWADKARFLARLALTPTVTEWSLLSLPAPLFPVYRLIRAGRLMARLIGSLALARARATPARREFVTSRP